MKTPSDLATLRFGDWLRQLRHDRGETQDAFGRELGFSKETIRSVESRYMRPSHQFVAQLLRLLDVDPEHRTEFERFARNGPVQTTAVPGWIRELARPGRPRLLTPGTPAQATRLIGRTAESAAVLARLRAYGVRLLTLVGAPGVGKTRLALAAAAELSLEFADGVHFVSLGETTEAHQVPLAICQTLGLLGDSPPRERLRQQMRDRHALVVLDNLEHLQDAAPLLSDMLATAPRLKLLATSRHVLRVYGEHTLQVPPLALPDMASSRSWGDMCRVAAVELFVERAQAVTADLELTDAAASDIAYICRELDGLPLAIELAAARCRSLSLSAIVDRIATPLDLLIDGPMDRPPRQQSLRGSLDWSYALLRPAERALFARLAVFDESGCTRAAAAELLGEGEAALERLVDRGLVHKQVAAWGEVRYRLLRTVRHYALERLVQNGELESLCARHTANQQAVAAA